MKTINAVTEKSVMEKEAATPATSVETSVGRQYAVHEKELRRLRDPAMRDMALDEAKKLRPVGKRLTAAAIMMAVNKINAETRIETKIQEEKNEQA